MSSGKKEISSKGDWTRDLPKYKQIGNAVPVKLAAEIELT
jgi:site-specific DNA-cytosine methylase